MAKKKDDDSDKKAAKKGGAFVAEDFMKAAMDAASTALGKDNVYVASEHDARQVGIPIPAFALRYLINNSAWPLQRMTSCGGPPKGHKSSFAYQLMRWTLDAGGLVQHIETENKATSDIMIWMLGPKYMALDAPERWRIGFYNTGTVNKWQQILHGQRDILKKAYEATEMKPGIPIMWNIDTLMGATTEASLQQSAETGETMGRGFSDAPILIAQFLRETPDMLLGWPIFLHITHQEKPGINMPGKVRAGGLAPDFYSSLDLQFEVKGTSTYTNAKDGLIERAGLQGKNIRMKVRRSSVGPGEREITVPFLIHTVNITDENGEVTRRTKTFEFDWHAATAELLLKLAASKKDGLSDVLDVESEMTATVGKRYWSKALGVSAKDALTAPSSERWSSRMRSWWPSTSACLTSSR
jgi:hypothetical protein